MRGPILGVWWQQLGQHGGCEQWAWGIGGYEQEEGEQQGRKQGQGSGSTMPCALPRHMQVGQQHIKGSCLPHMSLQITDGSTGPRAPASIDSANYC